MGVLVGTAIGIVVGIVLVIIQRYRFQRNYPAGDRKDQLISAIAKMKREGSSYGERLAYLKQQGIHKDVADVLLGEAERSGQ